MNTSIRTELRVRVVLFAVASTVMLTGCPGPGLTAEETTALYFALDDEKVFTYEAAGGIVEEHTYTKRDDELIFDRLVRRSGFIDDDTTVAFGVTDRALEILRFHDCVTLCGEIDAPLSVMERPLEAGASKDGAVTVTVTENGEPGTPREESHRFQVGSEEEITVPYGTFTGFSVIWSRTVDGVSTSANFVFAPDTGFVVVESFSGVRFELTDVKGGTAVDAGS